MVLLGVCNRLGMNIITNLKMVVVENRASQAVLLKKLVLIILEDIAPIFMEGLVQWMEMGSFLPMMIRFLNKIKYRSLKAIVKICMMKRTAINILKLTENLGNLIRLMMMKWWLMKKKWIKRLKKEAGDHKTICECLKEFSLTLRTKILESVQEMIDIWVTEIDMDKMNLMALILLRVDRTNILRWIQEI